MNTFQTQFDVSTSGRGFVNISKAIADDVAKSGITTGLCHVFLHHTSASLILCENADPQVQNDLEAYMKRLVPDGDSLFKHIAEGPDDMPAHVRSILTQNFLVLPVSKSRLSLGTWQGVYLWEHRLRGHQRRLTITVQGS